MSGGMQVAEVVAQVLLQAQTDVLIEVAATPGSPAGNVDSQVAQVGRLAAFLPRHRSHSRTL